MTYLETLFSLKGKVALVTGAARGNGKAIAESLLRAGAKVLLFDVLEKELNETADHFKSEYLDAIPYVCDLSNFGKIDEMIIFIKNITEKVDILINNAGVSFSNPVFDYPDEFWEKTYKVNVNAPFELSKKIGKLMRKYKSGVIINITSLNAELAFADNPAYVSAKGALKQLSKSLAMDLGKYGIRVNNVGPGYFKTQYEQKKVGMILF